MTEIQLSFFDLSFADAEAAADYRRKQQESETEAWLIKTIGAKAAKKHLAKEAKFKADLDAFMAGYVMSPRVAEALEHTKAKVTERK
jgi:hypothetical protein